MVSASWRYTGEEILAHLDGNFDIPDNGVNSDVQWLDDEEINLHTVALTKQITPHRRSQEEDQAINV